MEKPIKLIDAESALELRMALSQRLAHVKYLYRENGPEYKRFAHLLDELGIALESIQD